MKAKPTLDQRTAVTTALSGSRWQRAAMAARALRALMRDPDDTEKVFVLAIAINSGRIGDILAQLVGTDSGNWLLANKPSINSREVDYAALRALPNGTLGREYVRFLDDNGLDANFFDEPPGLAPLLAYIVKRIRQTHDVWHALTGYGSDPAGEVELQAFSFAQLGAPSAALIAVAGSLRGLARDPSLPRRALRAYRRGKRAAKLAPVIWEERWQRPVGEVRAELGVAEA